MKRLILMLGVVALLASVGQADILADFGYRTDAADPATDGLHWVNAYTGFPAPGWGPITNRWVTSGVDPNGTGYWELWGPMGIPMYDSTGATTTVELWSDNILNSAGMCGLQNAGPPPTGYDYDVAHDGYSMGEATGTSSLKWINLPVDPNKYYDMSFKTWYPDDLWGTEGAGTFQTGSQSYDYEADGGPYAGMSPALVSLVTFTGLQADPNGEIQMDMIPKIDPTTNCYIGIMFLELKDASMSGDFDRDADIDAADIDALGAQLGTDVMTVPANEKFDVNPDGFIDGGYVGESETHNAGTDYLYLIETILATKQGDAELDGDVDFADFGYLGVNYNSAGGWAEGDFNGDGFVDFADFGYLGVNYGWPGGGGPVPEPATLALLSLGSLVAIRRRK